MTVDLTKADLRILVLGTGGPGNYNSHPSGELIGFPNEHWTWNMPYINSLTEDQLWDLYKLFTSK